MPSPPPSDTLPFHLRTASALLLHAGLYAGPAVGGLLIQRLFHLPFLPLSPELGLLLGLLLLPPLPAAPLLATLFVFDDLALTWLGSRPPVLAALEAFARVGSLAIAFSLLAPRFRQRADPSRPSALVQILAVTAFAPFFPTLLAADAAYFLHHIPYLSFWLTLYLGEVNSLFLFSVPLLARACRPSAAPAEPLRLSLRTKGAPAYVILGLTLLLELLLPRYPLRFLAFPCLILIATRRPFFETALIVPLWGLFEIGRALFGGEAPFIISVFSLFERNVVTQILVFTYGVSALGFAASFSQMHRLRALHMRSLRRLRESERRFRELAAHSRDAIFRIGPDARRLYVSPAVTELFGFTPAEQVGRDWRDDVHPEDWPAVKPVLRAFLRGDEDNTSFSYRRRCKDGSFLWVETRVRRVRDPVSGETLEFVANTRDISAQKAAEAELTAANAKLSALAMSDGLTGIPNRRAFDQALPVEWARARRDGTALGLLVIDIDHFKSFNDFYGHLAGDDCLRTLAGLLRGVAHRMTDLPARYGGEEFVLLLPGADLAGCHAIAERIHERLAAVRIRNEIVPLGRVTVSIGIAAEEPGRPHESPEALFAAADRALYAAKRWGRNRTVAEDDPRLAGFDPSATDPCEAAPPPSRALPPLTPQPSDEAASPLPFPVLSALPPLSGEARSPEPPPSTGGGERGGRGKRGEEATAFQVTAKTS